MRTKEQIIEDLLDFCGPGETDRLLFEILIDIRDELHSMDVYLDGIKEGIDRIARRTK